MPTYEYECKKCGHQFEANQSISEEPLKHCPLCKGNVQRLVSGGTGFLMKGSTSFSGGRKESCSFTETGRTCCGASSPCGKSDCGD